MALDFDITKYTLPEITSMPTFDSIPTRDKMHSEATIFTGFNNANLSQYTQEITLNNLFTEPVNLPQSNNFNFFGAFNNFNFEMPKFNFDNINFTSLWNNWHLSPPKIEMPTFTVEKYQRTTKETRTKEDLYKAPKLKLPELADLGYDSQKGNEIAKEVRKRARGFGNGCGKYVGNALIRAGVFNVTSGRDAYKYPELLKDNPNFKEISTKNINYSDLPAGCILAYGKGVANYSKKFGHVEITLGNGKAASDGITNHIRSGARVFIPVETQIA